MPFYEYRCEACKHQVEVLQKLDDAPLVLCPSCGGSQMKKLMSATASVSSEKEGGACARGDISSAVPPCMTGGCGGCPTN